MLSKIENKPRLEFLFLVFLPFLLWVFCFRDFLFGSLYVRADAASYYDHIGFYTDSLRKGIYPLWDPFWSYGVSYSFFLRRIGDSNPIFLLMALLKSVGFVQQQVYMIFLAIYYFLATAGFYLIARLLLKDRLLAFAAYLILLFAWPGQLFYNYIVLIFTPLVWFFYFVLVFFRDYKRYQFLGMVFCLGIVLTTYIPFYFLFICIIFALLFLGLYAGSIGRYCSGLGSFINKNRLFFALSCLFLAVALVPSVQFYKESKAGDFVMPARNAGSSSGSKVSVGVGSIVSGDLISHGYFEKLFTGQSGLMLGQIFIPHIFFICLLPIAAAGVSRRFVFFLGSGVLLALLSTNCSPFSYQFLYEHVPFFKYIRNIYYLFFLAILPLLVLAVMEGISSLLKLAEVSDRPARSKYFIYASLCHIVFVVFLLQQEGNVLFGAWVCLGLVWLSFAAYCFLEQGRARLTVFILVFLAVAGQSVEAYHYLRINEHASSERRAAQSYKLIDYDQSRYTSPEDMYPMSESTDKEGLIKDLQANNIYYASALFSNLFGQIDQAASRKYLAHKFLFYDRVLPYDQEDAAFFKSLRQAWMAEENAAYVPRAMFKEQKDLSRADAPLHPEPLNAASPAFEITGFDPNTFKIHTQLPYARFLVINDIYHPAWEARINGKPARLLRANFAFKGIWVPAGESHIELRFQSTWRYLQGYALMAIFTLALIIVVILRIRRL